MEPGEYETMYRVEETHWWYCALHRLIIDRLSRSIPDWKNKPLLDAGCGTGGVLQHLGCSPNHTGIDLSPDAVEFCRRRGLPRVLQGDINKMPFETGTFDAIICSSVLYHRWVPDVGKSLLELHRVLKPGGFLLVNLPAFASLQSEHDERVFTARRFRRKEVRDLLRQSNFEIRECAYWTSFLFPAVWLARRLRLVQHGRDFEEGESFGFKNSLLRKLMGAEATFLKRVSLPFGVSIFVVARKP